MTLFVDASAMVAIVAGEEGADVLASLMAAEPQLLYSPMSQWEDTVALHRSHDYGWRYAQSTIDDLIATRSMTLVPIDGLAGQMAFNEFGNHGRGRRPAKLNMGDCFAYACGKPNNARLLYKGEDFTRTDLA